MTYASSPGVGLRRYDATTLRIDQIAQDFRGLPEGVTHSGALVALKRAGPYLGIPSSIIQMIDTLFAWTKDVDWHATQLPIVWPRNQKLADKLGLSVRQVQKRLDQAQRLGLLAHRDSPNGHRGGARSADGRIRWAYGIVLSPIGARYEEFRAAAERGALADAIIEGLRRRLASARRKIRCLAQTAIDNGLEDLRPAEEVALVLGVMSALRGERDPGQIKSGVEQVEKRQRALEFAVNARLSPNGPPTISTKTSCSHDENDTHSTTTIKPLTAIAAYSNGSATKSSGERSAPPSMRLSAVEADLDEHGVDADFISEVTGNLCPEFAFNRPTWAPMIVMAERLAAQNGIHPTAWREACSIMGHRGAAASVLATVQKYQHGEVQRPGAYLRGMSEKAMRGELRLGKTFHGLKDASRSEAKRSLAIGESPDSFGNLSRRVMGGLGLSR